MAIELWVAFLDAAQPEVDRHRALLSCEELRRAAGYRFDADRRRFIVGRGILRLLLGRELALAPERLELRRAPNGKPILHRGGRAGPGFNLSRAGELVVVALARDGTAVGVDVERVRELPWEPVADQFYSPAEQASLSALPAGGRAEGFLRCWTRKEAYLKATGDGLSRSLRDVDLSSVPMGWTLRDLTPQPGYVGALATPAPGAAIVVRRWPPSLQSG